MGTARRALFNITGRPLSALAHAPYSLRIIISPGGVKTRYHARGRVIISPGGVKTRYLTRLQVLVTSVGGTYTIRGMPVAAWRLLYGVRTAVAERLARTIYAVRQGPARTYETRAGVRDRVDGPAYGATYRVEAWAHSRRQRPATRFSVVRTTTDVRAQGFAGEQ